MNKLIDLLKTLTLKHYIIFSTLILILALLFLFFFRAHNKDSVFADTMFENEAKQSNFLYGICIDTLQVEKGIVQKNQFLANILLAKDVPYNVIDEFATKYKKVFDVRKIKTGNNFSFFLTRDSVPEAQYFVYEIDDIDYVVFHLRDSVSVWRGQKPIDTIQQTASGIISSSLWNSMVENGYDINLTLKLSEIYAWTIDFFGIQQGDTYSVIYDCMYVDGKPVGLGKIHAANLNHAGNDNYAFSYNQDSKDDFYDEIGQNLRKTFLKAPLNYSRVSSKFTNSRYHPVLKINRPHHGVDYAAPEGTPVYAIGDGTITKKGFQKEGGGNYLYIKHNSTYTTCYMHLQKYAKGIKQGNKVRQGQLIGYVGHTGIATGPHLDFRFFKNGTAVDPLKVKSPSAESIKPNNKQNYLLAIEPMKAKLHNVADSLKIKS